MEPIAYGLVVIYVAHRLAASNEDPDWVSYLPLACWWPFLWLVPSRYKRRKPARHT
jgi:hypothetical protein